MLTFRECCITPFLTLDGCNVHSGLKHLVGYRGGARICGRNQNIDVTSRFLRAQRRRKRSIYVAHSFHAQIVLGVPGFGL